MTRTAKVLLIAGLATVVAAQATAAGKPSPFASRVSCRAADVTIQWDGRTAVVKSGGRTLARATATSRSVSRSCAKIEDLPMYRKGLEETARGRDRIVCRPGPYIRIEVEPVRRDTGGIVGSRLAIFLSGWRVQTVEAFITKNSRWFSWSPIGCHTA
jgi:hypothetical protein